MYIYTHKKILALVAVIFFSLFTTYVSADGGILDVKVKVIDQKTAEISLTYPTPYLESTFSVLPSKFKSTGGYDSPYTLIRATNQLGENREFGDFTDGLSDAVVYTRPSDTSVTVTYRVFNSVSDSSVSLFYYPLFLGANYPRDAKVSITYPANLSLLAYPNSEKVAGIFPKTVNTVITVPIASNDYYVKNIAILLNKKTGYIEKKVGNFTFVAPKANSADMIKLLSGTQTFVPVYKQILGDSLPSKMVIAVVPIKDKTQDIETSAVQLSRNIVLFDSGNFSKDSSDLLRKKILAHELGHVVMENMDLFNFEEYTATWFKEGVASFVEQYISDMYLYPQSKKGDIDKAMKQFHKLKIVDVFHEYSTPIDYGFKLNDENHILDRSYEHSAAIFYNQYLRDKTFLPRLLTSLKTYRTAGWCESCDSDTIISVANSLNGVTKEDLLYPYKNLFTASGTVPIVNDGVFEKIFLK